MMMTMGEHGGGPLATAGQDPTAPSATAAAATAASSIATADAGCLAAMCYPAVFSPAFDRLRVSHRDDTRALTELQKVRTAFRHAEAASPGVLLELVTRLMADADVHVSMQEAFLRLQARAPADDLRLPADDPPELQQLSERAIALRAVLARVPEEMADRRAFLEIIKEIASSIKRLLDATNAALAVLPESAQNAVERRKREFVRYSKRFSTTLKDYFRDQDANPVYVAANELLYQNRNIIKIVAEKIEFRDRNSAPRLRGQAVSSSSRAQLQQPGSAGNSVTATTVSR